ncbi:tyrosine protein kinase [Kocuria sp. JC486]|uniref:YveK family protein n=1 Tax=Kocuria sp. JC486 TaxID=1970736 RepID=UPI001421BCD7|nr:tyrosine protein kinase [Kocuria sp. JC486]NHU85404.1 tyrosine protein kinase [Kocuria sp. JC486]
MSVSSPYQKNEISARDLGASVRRRWWLPVLGLLLGLGLSLGVATAQEPTYQSVTTALVHARTSENTAADRLAAEELAKSRASTYQSLGNSVVVADAVKQDLDLDQSTSELLEDVRVVAQPDTTDLEITATAGSPQEAADLASAWRDAVADAAGDPQPGDDIEVLPAGEPTVPGAPSGLSTPLIYAVGGAVGLLLGIIAAVSVGHPKNSRPQTR